MGVREIKFWPVPMVRLQLLLNVRKPTLDPSVTSTPRLLHSCRKDRTILSHSWRHPPSCLSSSGARLRDGTGPLTITFRIRLHVSGTPCPVYPWTPLFLILPWGVTCRVSTIWIYLHTSPVSNWSSPSLPKKGRLPRLLLQLLKPPSPSVSRGNTYWRQDWVRSTALVRSQHSLSWFVHVPLKVYEGNITPKEDGPRPPLGFLVTFDFPVLRTPSRRTGRHCLLERPIWNTRSFTECFGSYGRKDRLDLPRQKTTVSKRDSFRSPVEKLWVK